MNTTTLVDPESIAPGGPGMAPTWCSSAKDIVGCALGPARLWFTLGFGIVNEVYYPRVDLPQIRDLGFIVADDAGFWVEVKRMRRYTLHTPAAGIPAVSVIHRHPRFTLSLRITPDPLRDVLLIEVALEGDDALRPYALLAPHLDGSGYDNSAAVALHRGRRMLWAEHGPFGLALAAVTADQRDAWARASAGYVGTSDGWQDFARNGAMHWQFASAPLGNVALMGQLPTRCVLALGLASSKEAAATLAISALLRPFDAAWKEQVSDWQCWHATIEPRLPPGAPWLRNALRASAMVLRVHQDKIYPGAMVASLSVPWGNSGDTRGGYHLVWPRDLVECAGGLLVLGQLAEARNILRYLIATQHTEGRWDQNQWLDGKAFWNGIQLDEAGFPVLLAAMLAQRHALDDIEVRDMVERSLGYIARSGPASDQDRWEEDAGVNTFTLAVCIAALVAGADFLEPAGRDLALAIADDWNARIEDFTAVTHTELARRLGVTGYYVRTAPTRAILDAQAFHERLPIKNLAQDPMLPADQQIATDVLQLVRFGLRRADDPLIVDSIRVIDALLRARTPNGLSWRRYNADGYGEHDDGRPFDGTGIGRPWPLLTGERGHYELLAGRDALAHLHAMARMTSPGGMMPEQIWDAAPIPECGLYPGQPSGSAMPLAWTHAEFIKLALSVREGRACDCPEAVAQRYAGERALPRHTLWLQQAPVGKAFVGADLLVCLHEPARVHLSTDAWRNVQDVQTVPNSLGLHIARFATASLPAGARIDFTWYCIPLQRWIGMDYALTVSAS